MKIMRRSAIVLFDFVRTRKIGRGVAKMKGISSRAVLLLALTAIGSCSVLAAEDPAPNDGRVPLYIKAADPDGGELKFSWEQLEGPPVKIAEPHAALFDKATGKWISKTYFIPTEPGKYVFEVTVTNEGGVGAKRKFVQEVLRAVPPPVAEPGPDQKHKVGETVVLNGMNSKAFDGRTITQYQWSVKQAPPGFTLPENKSASRQLDFKAAIAGKYTIELRVFDGKRWGEAASVDIEIKKPSEPAIDDPPVPDPVQLDNTTQLGKAPVRPKADSGEGRANIHVGETVVLDGSASKVDPGEKPQFLWVQKDTARSPFVKSTKPNTSKPFDPKRSDLTNYPVQSFVAEEPGTYRFVLQITTEGSAVPVESAEVVNTVVAETGNNTNPPGTNPKPVPVVTFAPASVAINEEVRIDASKSISPSGAPLTFQWMQVPLKKFPVIRGQDGPVIRVSGESPGEYCLLPVVSDGKEVVKGDPISFTVVAAALPPVIETARTRECNVKDEIVLSAKVTDPANLPVEIKWTCIDPPIAIPEKFAKESQFRFQPNKPQVYLFRVEATNSKGLKASAEVQVAVKNPNALAPTAMLDGPERVTVGDTVGVSGARSEDPGHAPLTFKWIEETEGGPRIQGLVPARNKNVWRFIATDPGRIIVSLVVNNGTTDSAPMKWAIDVAPKKVDSTDTLPPRGDKPVARITGPSSAAARTEVELSGETSSSADGAPLSFAWSQPVDNGGPDLALTPSQMRGKTLRFTPVQPGMYILYLEVRDASNHRSDPAVLKLEVRAAAVAAMPRAAATLLTRDKAPAGKEVRLSAQGSVDPTGGALSYKWQQRGGPQTFILTRDNTEEISVTPAKAGLYEFELVVTSAAGVASAPTPILFSVSAPPAPQAKAVIAPVADTVAGEKVVLDGSGSVAQNGNQLVYQWRQIPATGAAVRLQVGDDAKPRFETIVPSEGKYVFELKVYDGNDWSEPAVVEFSAKSRGKNIPPIAVVDKLSITTEVGQDTIIDASASSDPDNGPEPLIFRWKSDGVVMKTINGPVNKFKPPTPGKLTFTVEAYDGKDFSEPVTIQVNVLPLGSLPAAVATVGPNPSKKSIRGGNAALKNLIVLDGTKSTPEDKIQTYSWSQISGDNLGLKPEQLSKEKVGLYIFKAGTYRFQLIVSDGTNSSKAATVDVEVEE